MEILRAKTATLFSGRPLVGEHRANSELNMREMEAGATVLESYPRRLVLELTNRCNLNCVMCGRNSATFRPTTLDMDTFRALEPLMDHVEEVTLMGWGEPTVNPGFADMLRIIADHGARAYFCTNGMRLDALADAILDTNVEVFAVSVDGATQESNAAIRRGSDLTRICDSLRALFSAARERGQEPPWVNFVLCAMRENLAELPAVVRLAHETGVREVKVVYLTAFDEAQVPSVLWGDAEKIAATFAEAEREAERLGVARKLPYVPGEDPAGTALHRPCYVPWRGAPLHVDLAEALPLRRRRGLLRPLERARVPAPARDRQQRGRHARPVRPLLPVVALQLEPPLVVPAGGGGLLPGMGVTRAHP